MRLKILSDNTERKCNPMWVFFLASVLFCVAFSPWVVMAQRAGNNRILVLEEEIIQGRIEKPEAFYILQPTNLSYEPAETEASFLPDLLETVHSDLF